MECPECHYTHDISVCSRIECSRVESVADDETALTVQRNRTSQTVLLRRECQLQLGWEAMGQKPPSALFITPKAQPIGPTTATWGLTAPTGQPALTMMSSLKSVKLRLVSCGGDRLVTN